MDVQDLVRQHYGDDDLGDRILDGLREVGVDTDHLTVEDWPPSTSCTPDSCRRPATCSNNSNSTIRPGCSTSAVASAGRLGWPPRPTAARSSGSTCHRTSSGSAGS